MVSDLREGIVNALHSHLHRILSAAEVGISKKRQYEAFRSFALNEFGNQGFLPELDALLKQHGQAGKGQAETAGKEVPK